MMMVIMMAMAMWKAAAAFCFETMRILISSLPPQPQDTYRDRTVLVLVLGRL